LRRHTCEATCLPSEGSLWIAGQASCVSLEETSLDFSAQWQVRETSGPVRRLLAKAKSERSQQFRLPCWVCVQSPSTQDGPPASAARRHRLVEAHPPRRLCGLPWRFFPGLGCDDPLRRVLRDEQARLIAATGEQAHPHDECGQVHKTLYKNTVICILSAMRGFPCVSAR